MRVVAMALVVAVTFAVSAHLQQRASRADGLSLRLVTNPLWLAGWLLNLTAFVGQGLALRLGSVAIVQSVVGLQVLVVLLLGAAEQRRLPAPATWLAAIGCTGSAAVLVFGIGVDAFAGPPRRDHAVVVVVAAAVGVAAVVRFGRGHVLALAIAAGCCSALTALLLKVAATRLLDDGLAALVEDWVGYALVACTVTSMVLVQWAFASGPLAWSIATMTAVNPLASIGIGWFAFDSTLGATNLPVIVTSGLLLILGAYGVSRSDQAGVNRKTGMSRSVFDS